MIKQFLDTDAIIRSIQCAFEHPIDLDRSRHRIRGMLTHMPYGSLHIVHDRNRVCFYENANGNIMYLRKNSDQLYLLARKRYLRELLRTIESRKTHSFDSEIWKRQFERLAKLIRDFAAGNLDIARIVLTLKQYAWFSGKYRQKPFSPDERETGLITDQGDHVLSKSEQNIGNSLWRFAVPCHYEEQLRINVQRLVDELASYVANAGQRNQNLFYYRNGSCYWNVPRELEFMNAPGSIWHTYDYRTGYITIHPDFTIMLIDGTLLYWEHEGLLQKPRYRVNASERVAVMRICGSIGQMDLIETTESEGNDHDALAEIIKKRIIPWLWF